MKPYLCGFIAAMLSLMSVAHAIPYTGFYRTIDDATGAAKSVVALYEYSNGGEKMLAGRVVALYDTDGGIKETPSNATTIAKKVSGTPTVVGTDVIWDMKWNDGDNQYSGGRIMDPANGKVYSSVIWYDDNILHVRGKIGPFGRTQNWHPVAVSELPADVGTIDMKDWQPTARK